MTSSILSRRLVTGSFVVAVLLALVACSSDSASSSSSSSSGSSGASGDACNTLCTGAKFASGKATDFGGGVIECQCEGTGTGVQKTNCETYCAPYKVPAAKALLSSEKTPNDKCVCDGT